MFAHDFIVIAPFDMTPHAERSLCNRNCSEIPKGTRRHARYVVCGFLMYCTPIFCNRLDFVKRELFSIQELLCFTEESKVNESILSLLVFSIDQLFFW